LIKILADLEIVYSDLHRMIAEYDTSAIWETSAITILNLKSPYVIASHQQYLYICDDDHVSIYNTNKNLIKQNSSLKIPFALDIDQKKGQIYVVDDPRVTIFNLNLEFISSWKLPVYRSSIVRGLKVDSPILYLTINVENQIFVCHSLDGKLITKWGNQMKSSNKGEFHTPIGLTLDQQYVYICDCYNHRVQILTKEGIFITQWGNGIKSSAQGEFAFPNIIYNDILNKIFYIGDNFCVQLFLKDGICIQRIGDKENGDHGDQFRYVYGVCVMDDRLYVCDTGNSRIQSFGQAK